MSTFANSEDQDEMQHNATLFVKVKKIFRQKTTTFFLNYSQAPLDRYNDYPMFIVSNQKEKSIRLYKGLNIRSNAPSETAVNY